MASLADFDLLSFVGYDGGGGLALIFASSAVLGGILFLLWFSLIMIGGIAADVFDGLFGTDFDAMGADASFKALTFQGIMAFMMFFGLGGLYVLESDSDQTSLAIVVGSLSGFASMYGTGKLFQLFVSLQSDGTIDMDDSIGSTGTIYLRIPEDGTGQIQVETAGALRTYNAKSEDGQPIATGDFAEVIGVVSSTLIVKRK
jgi:membrane protein implicated in regulation of membrane protease activity